MLYSFAKWWIMIKYLLIWNIQLDFSNSGVRVIMVDSMISISTRSKSFCSLWSTLLKYVPNLYLEPFGKEKMINTTTFDLMTTEIHIYTQTLTKRLKHPNMHNIFQRYDKIVWFQTQLLNLNTVEYWYHEKYMLR